MCPGSVSMLTWHCAFVPRPWSKSAGSLTLAARVSSLCGAGPLSSIGVSSGILNTVDKKVVWVEESLKYQMGGW